MRDYMEIALAEAQAAAQIDEVPVGAVVVDANGAILARAHNAMRQLRDPTAHAEILALRAAAAARGNERLVDCDLYVTLEPCTMCVGAIALARIRRLYYGAADVKSGATGFFSQPHCHHRPEIYEGLHEAACARLLRDFFVKKR